MHKPYSTAIKDNELVLLIAANNRLALATIYDKYSAPLYGTILKLVKNEEVAVKVLESTFIHLWNECRSGSCIPGSLFVYLHNLSRNMILEGIDEQLMEKSNRVSINKFGQRLRLDYGTINLS